MTLQLKINKLTKLQTCSFGCFVFVLCLLVLPVLAFSNEEPIQLQNPTETLSFEKQSQTSDQRESIRVTDKDRFFKKILTTEALIILAILMSFLLGSFVVYAITKVKIYNIIGKDLDSYINNISNSNYHNEPFFYLTLIRELKNKKDRYRKKLNEIKNVKSRSTITNNSESSLILELKEKCKKLESENQILKDKLELAKPEDNSIQILNNQKSEKTDSILEQNSPSKSVLQKVYFSIPDSDGVFDADKGVLNSDDRRFYFVEFAIGSSDGRLNFNSGVDDKRALNRYDGYLKAACHIENFEHLGNANRIQQIDPGKVTLINNKWQIIDKIKIRLI